MFTSGFGLPIYVYPIFYVKERKQNAVAESLLDRMNDIGSIDSNYVADWPWRWDERKYCKGGTIVRSEATWKLNIIKRSPGCCSMTRLGVAPSHPEGLNFFWKPHVYTRLFVVPFVSLLGWSSNPPGFGIYIFQCQHDIRNLQKHITETYLFGQNRTLFGTWRKVG